jgi:4-amino-4-deoxy-L-arabinose transferase-like glycosyltransferase
VADRAAIGRPSIRGRWLTDSGLASVAVAVPALIVGAVLVLLLAADPPAGITTSNAVRTDEAWDIVNARNLVLLGRWSTDDWNLHLVNVPYSVVMAGVFSIFGVGIEPARLVSVAATVITIAALGVGLRRAVGGGPALVASVAFGGATLVLFYGRLAFLEPSVAMCLTIGVLLVLRARADRSRRWGVAAGVAFALAIGTKPSVLFAIIGLLGGLAAVGFRERAVRRWLGGATAAIVAAALGWIFLIGVPNREAVAADLRIWPAEPIFASPAAFLRTVATFPIRNDHMLILTVPLLLFGGAGAILVVHRRRDLRPEVADLAATAIGWLILGYGLLAVAPYRPNRYEVPLLPALAILGAIGCSLLLSRRPAPTLRSRGVALTALAAAIAAPGALSTIGWARSATFVLPSVQAQVAAAVRPGDVVEGLLAPAFALETRAVTLVSEQRTRINPGDLYATRGVRWFVGGRTSKPSWAKLHADAWSRRVELLCVDWTGRTCVWRVP